MTTKEKKLVVLIDQLPDEFRSDLLKEHPDAKGVQVEETSSGQAVKPIGRPTKIKGLEITVYVNDRTEEFLVRMVNTSNYNFLWFRVVGVLV